MEIENNSNANDALTKETSEMEDKMRHLYNLLANQTDPERDIMEPFMSEPCKKTYPDYYNFIKNPINLVKIDERITSNYYKTMKTFRSDVNLMFENCKSYNESDSLLHQDACKLQKIFNKVKYSYLFLPSQRQSQHEVSTLMDCAFQKSCCVFFSLRSKLVHLMIIQH